MPKEVTSKAQPMRCDFALHHSCIKMFIISSVCRLLEQEKMSHNDLKQTWEMANVQFVENLRVQGEAFTRVWNILTPDQRTAAQQQQQPQVGQLIDLQSPQTSPQSATQQVVYLLTYCKKDRNSEMSA